MSFKKKGGKKRTSAKSNSFKKRSDAFVLGVKKHRHELRRTLFVLLFFVFLYFAFLFIFQLRSSYAEQIVMETYPQYVFIDSLSGVEENISITTDVRTNLLCRGSCEYNLKDLSQGLVVERGSFDFFNVESHVFDSSLLVDELGAGQKLFLFEVSCSTSESRFCAETLFPVIRTSLISFNYDLSEEQQFKKDEVEALFDEVVELYFAGKSNILSAEARLENVHGFKKDHLSKEVLRLGLLEEILALDIEMIDEDWLSGNYSFVHDQMMSRNVVEKAVLFNQESEELLSFIGSEKEVHNRVVSFLRNVSSDFSFFEGVRKAGSLAGVSEPSPSWSSFYSLYSNLNSLIGSGEFRSYQELLPLVEEAKSLRSSLLDYYEQELLVNDSFVEQSLALHLFEIDLCVVSGGADCLFPLNFSSPSSLIEAVNFSTDICSAKSSLSVRGSELLDERLEIRDNLSLDFLERVDEEKLLVEESVIQWLIQNSSEEVVVVSLLNNYSSSLLNGSVSPDYYPFDYDDEFQEFFLVSDLFSELLEEYFIGCDLPSYSLPSIAADFINITEVVLETYESIALREVVSTCCFDSVCRPCCDYDDCLQQLRNPLIVLHGYSFYSFNSAFHSANAYNDFVAKALEDGLYYPAGIIGPSFFPEFEDKDLTRVFVPPVFKATYYDVLRFDEITFGEFNIRSKSIFDHADTLHELVEFVRNVTGKQEVDIVAHSMGGLVTRAYIDAYGDDSLGKIVLVGTPNKGVPARLLYLCKFFGGQMECDDMYRNSAFMNYMNEEATLPEKEVHMIVGEGCSTFGEDGDGIVHTSSAVLDFAENHFFTGSCELIDNFHRDMIKPSKYPEIYEKIMGVLLS